MANLQLRTLAKTTPPHWLTDEEDYRLDSLYEVLSERGAAIDPRIKPLCASSEDDLVHQMVNKLG